MAAIAPDAGDVVEFVFPWLERVDRRWVYRASVFASHAFDALV